MRLWIVIITLFLIAGLNCSQKSTTPTESFTFSGTIYQESKPLEGAMISVVDHSDLSTQSDSYGHFVLSKIPAGDHSITILKNSDGNLFSERVLKISMTDNVVMNDLVLPVGVRLYEAMDITDQSIKLTWSPIDASDFKEYKIYKHQSSGIDENTGTLVHVSTDLNDTCTSISNLDPLTEYFFRVYTMNEMGRLGGSNVISVKTKNLEIIKNGSFEILNPSTGYPENWQAYLTIDSYYYVDNQIVQNGKNSIRIENAPGVNTYYQLIRPELLVAGNRYKISYWVKYDQMIRENDQMELFLNTVEFNWHIIANILWGPKPASDWQLMEYEFTAPSVTTSNFRIEFYFFFENGGKAWLDNISLTRIE